MPKPNQQLAKAFNALAHPRRVTLFHLLKSHAPHPLNFGTLQHLTKFTPAVLSHHLRFMEQGGLITRRQVGSFSEFRLLERDFHASLHPILQQLTKPNLKVA